MSPYEPGVPYPKLSLAVDLIVLVCILSSCLLILFEHLYPHHERTFFVLEVGFTVIFVVEYLMRWYSADARWKYPFTFFAVVDLVAILPSLMIVSADLMMVRVIRGVRLLRMLRLLRLLRLLKFIRYGFLIYRGVIELRTWFNAINDQYRLKQLARLSLWAMAAWIVGANLVYLTETRLVDAEGPFGHYWASYWHILIVLISGIEDKEPLSLLGRIEVTALLVIGICIVGLLTGEIVAILVKKSQRAGKIALKPPNGKLAQHILILGHSSHLDQVIRQVRAATKSQHYMLVVCPEAEELRVTDREVYRKVFVLAGDPSRTEVLEEACVDEALRVIVLASERRDLPPHLLDGERLMQMLAVIARRRPVPMVVELHEPESEADAAVLGDEGVEFVLVRRYGEGLITQAVLNPGVTTIYDQLMTFTTDTNEFYTLPVPNRLVGRHFREAQLALLDNDDDDIVLVGIDRSPAEEPNTRFVLNPMASECQWTDEDKVLREGDNLVVLAFTRPSFAEVEEEDLWSGRVLKRT